MSEITLTGLDGSNPMAFLAALGVINAINAQQPQSRLFWKHAGRWQPTLTSSLTSDTELIALLNADRLSCVGDPALSLVYDGKRDLKPRPDRFRDYLRGLVGHSTAHRRRSVGWAAAFATDVVVDNNGNTKPTALHFAAGQQQFLEMANRLCESVTADNIAEAVFGPWQYASPLPVMGWDGTASRDYALRASNPSTDKKLGVPGADWLAIRGMAALPVAPIRTRLFTTGCSGGWKNGSFQWPLWSAPLSYPVILTTLQMNALALSREERRARGISVVFSSGIKRSDQGGYGSFEPASVG